MIRLSLFLAGFPALMAQSSAPLPAGARIFEKHCSVPYCHGPAGAEGRAPALAGKPFTRAELAAIVSGGKSPGMPAFEKALQRPELDAVVGYVLSLAGTAPAAELKNPAAVKRPPAAARGRELFFDAVRMGGCGSCHELEGWGTPVGPNLAGLNPASGSALRAPAKPSVVTAQPAGEAAFPAVAVQQGTSPVRVYDLSSRLPVLRTFAPDRVKLAPGGKWDHAAVTSPYSDAELDAIGRYLQWLAAP